LIFESFAFEIKTNETYNKFNKRSFCISRFDPEKVKRNTKERKERKLLKLNFVRKIIFKILFKRNERAKISMVNLNA